MKKLAFILLCLAVGGAAMAQTRNRYEEVLPMKEGMVVDVKVGNWQEGKTFPFAIDLGRRRTAVASGKDETLWANDTLRSVALGEHIFLANMAVDTQEVRMPVDGVLGLDAFVRTVITIDREGGMITVSAPYKPAYMPLRSRRELLETLPILDSLLDEGVVTLDFVHGKSYFLAHADKPEVVVSQTVDENAGQSLVTHLNTGMFLREVFDFRAGGEWKYLGEEPCVIDFWAPWCGPCLKLSPSFEAMAKEYEGRVKFYKVNVDNEPEIASYFKVTAIPLLVFIPVDGQPSPVMLTTPEEIRENVEKIVGR